MCVVNIKNPNFIRAGAEISINLPPNHGTTQYLFKHCQLEGGIMTKPPPHKRNKATSAASTDSTSAANSVNEDISQQEDPGSATITVSAVEVPELTEQEISDKPDGMATLTA
jgi:hypothetical protein